MENSERKCFKEAEATKEEELEVKVARDDILNGDEIYICVRNKSGVCVYSVSRSNGILFLLTENLGKQSNGASRS